MLHSPKVGFHWTLKCSFNTKCAYVKKVERLNLELLKTLQDRSSNDAPRSLCLSKKSFLCSTKHFEHTEYVTRVYRETQYSEKFVHLRDNLRIEVDVSVYIQPFILSSPKLAKFRSPPNAFQLKCDALDTIIESAGIISRTIPLRELGVETSKN